MKKKAFKTNLLHCAALLGAGALAVSSIVLHKDVFFVEKGEDADLRLDRFSVETERQSGGFSVFNAGVEKTLDTNEKIVAVLTLDGDFVDEQVAAYRNENEFEGQIFVTQIQRSPETGEFVRVMNEKTAARDPSAASLYSQDLLGDHSVCILLSGMTAAGEHTLTVWRIPKTGGVLTRLGEWTSPFPISVNENERGDNYNRGIRDAESWTISTRGRSSSGGYDQIETIFSYNADSERYEESAAVQIPSSGADRDRQREILSGGRASVLDFAAGLWYFVGVDGSANRRQYVYLEPGVNEIIFYSGDTQEVFTWGTATATRYGVYLVTQNISVTTLRRFVDIEIVSQESLRLKVFEDVQLKIETNTQWDGTYRKTPLLRGKSAQAQAPVGTSAGGFIEGEYESSGGRMFFTSEGFYSIENGDGSAKSGRYAFFTMGGEEMLELRPATSAGRAAREVYAVSRDKTNLILYRARIGVKSIERYREAPLALYAMQVEDEG